MEYDKIQIENIIKDSCQHHKVTPLFVVEAGSRLYGMEGPKSDIDIREYSSTR